MSKSAATREKDAPQSRQTESEKPIGRIASPPPFSLTAAPMQLQKPQSPEAQDDIHRYKAAKVLSAELVQERQQKLFAALRADKKYNELMNSPGNERQKKQVYAIIANIVRIKREGTDDRLYNLYKDQFAAAFSSKQALPKKEVIEAPDKTPSESPKSSGPGGPAPGKQSPSSAPKERKYTKLKRDNFHNKKPYQFEYEMDRSNLQDMHLRVKVGLAGGKAEVAKIKSQKKAIEDIYGKTKGITLELVFVPAGTPGALHVNAYQTEKKDDGTEVRARISADNWGIDPTVNAHELGHPLGLRDRYDHIFAGTRNDFTFEHRLFYIHKATTDNQYSTTPGLMRYLSESTRFLPEEVCTMADMKGKDAFDHCVKEQKKVNK